MSALTIIEALQRAANSSRGIRVIEHPSRSLPISYETLLADSLTIGGALQARGLKPGDRVALVMPEVADFVEAFFGISAAGLVPVPLFPPAQAGDLPTFTRQSRHILDASHASAVVTSVDVAPLLDVSGISSAPIVLSIDDLRGGPQLDAPVSVSADQPALLQFTSGSTAAPKGVVLTHANIDANTAAIAYGLDLRPDDVGVSWLPLYHDMGLIGMLIAAIYNRVDVILMSPTLFLKRPTVWLDTISTYKGTISFAPNFAYRPLPAPGEALAGRSAGPLELARRRVRRRTRSRGDVARVCRSVRVVRLPRFELHAELRSRGTLAGGHLCARGPQGGLGGRRTPSPRVASDSRD